MSLLQIVLKGGVLIIPILLCSLIAVTIIVERWLFLRKAKINARSFILQVKALILKNRIGEAILLCKRTTAPVAKITKAAVERYNRPRIEIKEAIESTGKVEIHNLERGLGVLSTIAAIAPLLGFLGTVTGMIRAFIQVQNLGGNVAANLLNGQI
ncbi:MAG: MotA/TolQ/ExbB proton channel family protein [candidate division KSB1 bacterium]|nr:MotA/TolQ/ExbB proton channel family protein [candidate division KSB1 bacterium]